MPVAKHHAVAPIAVEVNRQREVAVGIHHAPEFPAQRRVERDGVMVVVQQQKVAARSLAGEIGKRQRGYLKHPAADAITGKSGGSLSELAGLARRERDAYRAKHGIAH
jgi:hypothetical protein